MTNKALRWGLLVLILAALAIPTFGQDTADAPTQPSPPASQAPPAAAGEVPILSRIPIELYPQSFPGQFWNDTGNVSPVEHSDVISASYFEQGVTLWRDKGMSITPYAAVGVTVDTQGYDWNNRVQVFAGARFNKYFKYGIVSVGGAYSYEDRWIGNEKTPGPTGEVTYWFGWQLVGNPTSRFPGSTWGAAGYLTPVESGNFIYNQNFKQGVVAHRFGMKNMIVPFGEVTSVVDTKHYDWENRVLPGAGVEFVHLHGNTQTELGAEYLYEHRFESGLSASEVSIFFKFWFGWNPIRGGKH
jgi:hypothetical protein